MPSQSVLRRALGFLAVWLGSLLAIQGEPLLQLPESSGASRLEPSVMVPMRDGVRLSTDLYFPPGPARSLPAILMRTPYNKATYRARGSSAWTFAGHGYVVAVQDVRGRYESAGEYVISAYDREDGFDMVSWLAGRPWSNGKVGTLGCSYLGENQIQLAAERHPKHLAAVPQAAGGSRRYFGIYLDGALELSSAVGWFRSSGSKYFLVPPPGAPEDFWARWGDLFNPAPQPGKEVDYRKLYRTLPLIDLLKQTDSVKSDWEDIVSHLPGDPWWDQLGYVSEKDRFDVPALHVGGWYDLGVADTLALFGLLAQNAESSRARDHQYAVISPATHCRWQQLTENAVVGQRWLGDASFDYDGLYLQWFDYWLKGIRNGVIGMPKLQLFVMGRNEWRGEEEWPLARTRYVPYYLKSDGRANSRYGSGRLAPDPPSGSDFDEFVYDPGSPVPTVGGPICCNPDTAEGAFDQSDVETRNDILVYTTEVFPQGVEVTGPIKLILHVSSTALDTDFTAKLVDVYPDGKAYNIQEGILRVRYRNRSRRPELMEPGKIYEIALDLQATSNFFGPGHRIRLEVSSSNFPRFDRNLNTGGNNYSETEWRVATNRVHHSRDYPSHLLLPVIP